MEIIDRYSAQINGTAIYFRPNIPSKKATQAIASYAPGMHIEQVLVLVDDTVFGSAKEGMIITADHIHVKEIARKPKSIAISSVSKVESLGTKILVNGEPYTEMPSIAEDDIALLCQMISEMASCSTPQFPATEQTATSKHDLGSVPIILAPELPSVSSLDPTAQASKSPFPAQIKVIAVLAMIGGIALIQNQAFPINQADPDLMHEFVTIAITAILIIGTIGTILARNQKITIFSSAFDVLVTGVAIILGIMYLLDWDDPGIASVVHVGSISINALFLWLSYNANKSILKMILVIPSKILCVALLLFLGLITAMTAVAASRAVRDREYGKAARLAGATVAAGAGATFFTRFLESLIRNAEKHSKC